MNCHGENTLQPINKRLDFLKSCRISGHFDTRFTTIAQIEQILQESKDPKIDNILNLERVYFLVTRVTSPILESGITYWCNTRLCKMWAFAIKIMPGPSRALAKLV